MKNIFNKIGKYYREAFSLGHYSSFHKIIFTKDKIFPYYGFLGDNNFGDELVFEATKELFKPNILIPIKRRMPILHRLFCYVNKRKMAGVVIGGGTLIGPFWEINFFEKLIKLKKPVFVHGTGVHETIQYGKEWKNMFGGLVYGGVRGPLSKKNLHLIDTEIEVAGDAAFAIFNENIWKINNCDTKNNNIVVNLGTHSDFEDQHSCRQEIYKFLDILIEKGYNVHFLPFHNIDCQLGKQIIKENPAIILLKQPKDFEEAVKIFQQFSFAIGERLHFIVMAILTKTPFLSINYGKKHEDLLKSLNANHTGVDPSSLKMSEILSYFDNRSDFDWNDIYEGINNYKIFQREAYKNLITKTQ